MARVEDLQLRAALDIACGDCLLPRHIDARRGMFGTIMKTETSFLEVQDDIGDVLDHSIDCGEFVEGIFEANRCDRRSSK